MMTLLIRLVRARPRLVGAVVASFVFVMAFAFTQLVHCSVSDGQLVLTTTFSPAVVNGGRVGSLPAGDDLTMATGAIHNLADPTAAQDGATEHYVLAQTLTQSVSTVTIGSTPTNNWSPTALATSVTIAVGTVTPSSASVTGIDSTGAALGRTVYVTNLTAKTISFTHDDGGSTAGNRLEMIDQTTQSIVGKETIAFLYNGTDWQELWQSVASGGSVSGLTPGTVPVAATSSSLGDSPLLVVGGILELNANQNAEQIDGVCWSTGDMRTDGNLEAGAIGSPVVGTDCGSPGCLALSAKIRFSNSSHQPFYDITPAEIDEAGGSGATNTNIEINASGPGGIIILNGNDSGSNSGAGGVQIRKGQAGVGNAWVADSSGDTSQAGTMQVASTSVFGGSMTISSGFIDVNGTVYAQGDTTMLEGHGFACDYNTNATSTCHISPVGYSDSTGDQRDLEVDDGHGTGTSHLGLYVNGGTHGAYTGAGGIGVSGSTGPTWTSGTGAPGGTCVVGSLYSNVSGGASTTLYVCTGTSTWTAK
jgi:hypothetical protein